MSCSGRYVEPAPSVRVIDFGRQAGEDRFSPPKASINFSLDGKRIYGVLDRPACRVLRYAADAATAAANVASEERQCAQPSGRRHEALKVYLEGVRRNQETLGFDVLQARSAARAITTMYRARLGGSEGVANCLVWHPDREIEDADGQMTPRGGRPPVSAELARPGTAPAATCGSMNPASLDLWSQMPYTITSPRFKSRAAFEQRRCATPDTDAIKRSGYLAQHQQRKAAAAVKEAREVELIRSWPHGLPTAMLRAARGEGLHPPAIEHCHDGPRILRSSTIRPPPRSC